MLLELRTLPNLIGKVVDNNDPLMMNRIQVEIPNITDTVDSNSSSQLLKDHLPWYPVRYNGVNNNITELPEIGSWVIVEFMDETIYNGVVVGGYSGTPQSP